MTLLEIKKHMLEYLTHREYLPRPISDEDEYYDEDGYTAYPLYNKMINFWENFSTDKHFEYVVSAEFASELDLEGGRDYILNSSKVYPMLFDYMYNTLEWSHDTYYDKIHNSVEITDELEELYNSIPIKREEAINELTKL